AAKVAQSLRGKAASVRVVNLPGLPPKGDVSDWLAAGGTREQLEKLVAAAPETHQQDDGEASEDEKENDQREETQAQALIRAAAAAVRFHDAERRAYATVPVGDHHETLPLSSGDFKRWLVRAFYRAKNKPPSATSLSDALRLLEAQALFDGPERLVHV